MMANIFTARYLFQRTSNVDDSINVTFGCLYIDRCSTSNTHFIRTSIDTVYERSSVIGLITNVVDIWRELFVIRDYQRRDCGP